MQDGAPVLLEDVLLQIRNQMWLMQDGAPVLLEDVPLQIHNQMWFMQMEVLYYEKTFLYRYAIKCGSCKMELLYC